MIRSFSEGEGTGPAKDFKKAAVKVIKHIGSNTVEKVTGGLLVPTKLLADLNEEVVDTTTEERLDKYQKAQEVNQGLQKET